MLQLTWYCMPSVMVHSCTETDPECLPQTISRGSPGASFMSRRFWVVCEQAFRMVYGMG